EPRRASNVGSRHRRRYKEEGACWQLRQGRAQNRGGLVVRARLERRRYPIRKKATNEEFRELKIELEWKAHGNAMEIGFVAFSVVDVDQRGAHRGDSRTLRSSVPGIG